MTEYTEISGSIPERGLMIVEGYFYIKEGRIRLFLKNNINLPIGIDTFFCKQPDGRSNYFEHCQVIGVGDSFYEYAVENGYFGMTKEILKTDRYTGAIARFSKEIGLFFEPSFTIKERGYDMTINFVPAEERKRTIHITNEVELEIRRGYSKVYPSHRFSIEPSITFELRTHSGNTKTEIFSLLEVVRDFFFLFYRNSIAFTTVFISLSEEEQIFYAGEGIEVENTEDELFRHPILKESKLGMNIDPLLVRWTSGYEKIKIAIELLKSGLQLKDSELRFICFSRCIEILHKVISNQELMTRAYIDELYKYLVDNNLTDANRQQFSKRNKTTLSLRMSDLIRSIYPVIKGKRFFFYFLTNSNAGKIFADSRNYYIHLVEGDPNIIWAKSQLKIANTQLYYFIKLLLLRSIHPNPDSEIVFLTDYISRFNIDTYYNL